ncbi:MAG: hypothetical protein GOU97_01960 [Nanoarchaeota archaeon]|nr:hypothetical protein [Nanoarchaeota archaeon]
MVKITRNFLKRVDVQELLELVGGPNGEKILMKVPSTKFVSEFSLADLVNIHINKVRSILYKFYEHKIVEFTKHKDLDRGLYIYSWRLLLDNVKSTLIKNKKAEIKILQDKLLSEGLQNHFKCHGCGTFYTYDQSLNNNFSCPYDDSPLKMVDRQREVRKIRRQVSSLEKQIMILRKMAS